MKLHLIFCVILVTYSVKGDVPDIDVTLFDLRPLVDSMSDKEFRTYVPWIQRDVTFTKIGRNSYTGTGEIGTGYDPPDESGEGADVPDGSGFPPGTTVDVTQSFGNFRRLWVTFPQSSTESIGVFYVITEFNGVHVSTSTVKISRNAKIKPRRYTTTASIGDSVSLRVTTDISDTNHFRWLHNDVKAVSEWNGQTDVTIDNVRLADAGIYECYEDGQREDGEHSIMILIVRECPSSRYGSDCTEICLNCWNGGVCDAKSGKCICPPGFKGTSCEITCGSNAWGASCSLACDSNDKTDCKGKLMCPPDPVGCSCIAGYMDLDCNKGCEVDQYGANCEISCHCSNNNITNDCDPARGCIDNAECDQGYGGYKCQVKNECEEGYFGEQCNRKCHCIDDGSCEKISGQCSGDCAIGWAGEDCLQMLPSLYLAPRIDEVYGLNFTISWDEWEYTTDYGVGPAEQYQVHCGLNEESLVSIGELTSGLTANISLQIPDTSYLCAVSVGKTVDGTLNNGKPGPTVTEKTQCGPPIDAPTFTQSFDIGSYYITLVWKLPQDDDWKQCSQGLEGYTIIYYQATHPDEKTTIDITDPTAEFFRVSSLTPCTNYTFFISARNWYSSGPYSSQYMEETNPIAPESPTNLRLDVISSSTLRASWEESKHLCGVDEYVISYEIENYDHCNETVSKPTEYLRTSELSIDINDLEVYSEYDISIGAALGNLLSPLSRASETTGISVPLGPPNELRNDKSVSGKLTFRWQEPRCGLRKGPISKYGYQIAEKIDGDSPAVQFTEYLSVTLDNLKPSVIYQFRVASWTTEGEGPFTDILTASTTESGSIVGMAVGVSIGVIFVFIIVIIIFLRVRRSKKNSRIISNEMESSNTSCANPYATRSHPQTESIVLEDTNKCNETRSLHLTSDEISPPLSPNTAKKPIQSVKPASVSRLNNKVDETKKLSHFKPNQEEAIDVSHLIGYVKERKINAPDHKLKSEYQSLPRDETGSKNFATMYINTKKNRYRDILPYDHSRVILETIPGDPDSDGSDYINASYIDGYQTPNAYIAAQGPNKTTIADMWRMIWQEQTKTVIMATNLMENDKRKCEQYWPTTGKSAKYGSITVSNENEDITKNYTKRTFIISKKTESNGEAREIQQFHFTGWLDMDAPEFGTPVLQFLDAVNAYNPPDAGPMVVHCSAGVGRTGSFLAIDTMRKMAEAEGKVDVFGYTKYMRTRRPKMIQVEAQYVFVYEALLEALFCGETTIRVRDMDQIWSDITRDNSLLGSQLQALDAMYPGISEGRCSKGKYPENISKNRFSDCIPPDLSSPHLMSTSNDIGEHTYINAVFCDGYSRKDVFLATQVPLPDTVDDFWAMVHDYKCGTIVALNDPLHMDQTCGIYLPDEGAITCGLFSIELLDTEVLDHTTERKLQLTKLANKSKIVTHIEYMGWSAHSQLPKSSESFMNLLSHTEKSCRDTEDHRIAAMCLNGVDRCGLFCAMVNITDQIKEDQQVDVFQAVKRLKRSRDDMVDTMEQYQYCYEIAQEYIKSFDDYANFTA